MIISILEVGFGNQADSRLDRSLRWH